MARSVDQAPHNPYDNSNHDPRPRVHPERVPTSLDGSTPVYEDWKPRSIDTQPKNKNKLAALIALGGVAATGIVGAAAFFGMKSATSEQIEKVTSNTSNSTEPFPEAQYIDPLVAQYDMNQNGLLDREERDAMAPEDYITIDSEVSGADKAEQFSMYLHTGWDSIKETLNDNEKSLLSMPDLNKPRAEWSDQDYLNYKTLAIWLVTRQQDQDEGLRALSTIADPDTKLYANVSEWIKENPGVGLKAVQEAIETPVSNKEFYNESIGANTIGPDGGRLVGYKSLVDDTVNYTLFKNTSDDNGNVITNSIYTYDTLVNPELRGIINSHGS